MTAVNEAPEPIEVNDFKFLQLRKLKLAGELKAVPDGAINLVATSSRYGLIFVGLVGGFKVLKLENVLDLDEDKEKFRQPAENYSCQIVRSATPTLISLSSDDMTLAVCIRTDSRVIADMYDIRAFADVESVAVPFLTVQLSSYPADLQDFMWNPVIVEKYAYCLSDGSLHVHEIVDTTLNITAGLPAETAATSVCWSPKGKQVVVGKRDGSFSQYKPNLQEAKKIPAPMIDGSEVEVLNICWLTTTSFAVVYLPHNSEERMPSLVLVSTPKGTDISYTTYGDVCFGTRTDRKPRYSMYHQPEWGILVCFSSNSVETAVIGCLNPEKASWIQWFLEGDGRAEMPYDKKKETYPLGMSLIFCAQRRIMLNDTMSYPPMPVIFFLSTSGLLCPFHVVNVKPGVSNHVFPSEPICVEGERKCAGGGQDKIAISSPVNAQPDILALNHMNQVPNVNIFQPSSSPSMVMKQETGLFPNVSPFAKSDSKAPFSFGRSDPMHGSVPPPPPPAAKTQSIFAPLPTQGQGMVMPQIQTRPQMLVSTPESFTFQSQARPMASIGSMRPTPPTPVNSVAGIVKNNVLCAAPAVKITSEHSPQPPTQPQVSKTVTASVKPTPNQDAYVSVIRDELCNFENQLVRLKKMTSRRFVIGTKEEMASIKKHSLLLKDFHKDLADTMQSLNLDTHNLQTASLENFAMVGEANSRNLRRNDPRYLSMIRDRALDPISAKQMQRIQQLYQYLSTQLQEVHDKLDRDLVEFREMQKKKHRNRLRIPSTQAVYQTVVNNQNIIYNLKAYLEHLSKNFSKVKQNNVAKGHHFLNIAAMSSEGELEKLADVLLDKPSTKTTQNKRFGNKKLPPKVLSALRDAFADHRVTCVRPKVILDPSQSQLLSTAVLHPETRKTPKKAIPPSAEMKTPPSVNTPVTAAAMHPESQKNRNIVTAPPLEVKPLSAFTVAYGPQRGGGGITQGTPVARPVLNSVQKMVASVPDSGMNRNPALLTLQSRPQLGFSQTGPFFARRDGPIQAAPTKSMFFQVPQSLPITSQRPTGSSYFPGFNIGRNSATFAVKPPIVIKPIPNDAPNSKPVVPPSTNVYDDISPPSSPAPSSEDVFVEGHTSPSSTPASPSGSPVSSNNSPTVPSFNDTSPSYPFVVPKYPSAAVVDSASTENEMKRSDEQNNIGFSRMVKPIMGAAPSSVMTSPSSGGVEGTAQSSPKDENAFAPKLPLTRIEEKPIESVQPSATPNSPVFGSTSPGIFSKSPFSASNTVFRPSTQPAADKLGTGSIFPTELSNPIAKEIVAPLSTETQVKDSKESSYSTTEQVSENVAPNSSVSSILKEAPTNQLPLNSPISKPGVLRPSTIATSGTAQTAESTESKTNLLIASGPEPNAESSTIVTTSSNIFGGSQTTSLFGAQQVATTSASPFSQPSATTTTTSTTSPFFGQSTTSSSFFGSVPRFATTVSAAADTTTTTTATFGQNTIAATTTTSSFFSAPVSTQSSFFSKPAPVFGQPATATTTASAVFGQPVNLAVSTSSPFGQVTTTTSPFGQSSSPFQQGNAAASPFGQTAGATSPFSQATSGFFNQASPDAAPGFGQKDRQSGSPSVFGGQPPSGFTFGKSSFGQTSPNTFGLAKAVFGEPANQNSGPFSQSPDQSLFGRSSFFGGLGGKPSEQNVSKNVFGSVTGPPPNNTTNLFGNQGASTFGVKPGSTFSSGSFSATGGSVSQSGFAAFQQGAQKTGAFGGSPSFGSPPAFGGSPSFGSPPAFGASPGQNTLGSPPFGAAQSTFSNFAATDAPTFGSLASQSGGFGSLQQPQAASFGQPAQGNLFGGGGGGSSVFGGGAANPPPTFGSQQSGFGSPSGGSSSAFTQWRN